MTGKEVHMYRGVTKQVELQDDGTKTVKLKYSNGLIESCIKLAEANEDNKSLKYYQMMFDMLKKNNIAKYKEAYPKLNYVN